ncbi:MAG: Bax inhibitor-1/YccA family protein [Clostridia bacterium]|nr:Bax inhibitor-1/YccA family protein [Clostridia bacterium]NCC42488.1 Bax inhibitor-1/YccA family protein [Clostridia bacterium]
MAAEGAVSRGTYSRMCNPVIKKMAKKAHTLEVTGEVATYAGVAGKTIYFLVMCVIGVAAFFVLHNIFMADAGAYGGTISVEDNSIFTVNTCLFEGATFLAAAVIVLFAPLFAWLIRPLIPVVGTLYAVCEGYFLGMITQSLNMEYKWISLAALVLTASIVAVMLFLYTKRIVKVTKKFKTILSTCFFSIVIGGILIAVLSIVPFTRPMMLGILTFMNSPIISIGGSVLFIIIASLFLLVDFDTIESCVENKMPKKLEWMAAFGLVYTIIYIYFKILNLIIHITSTAKSN